MELTASSISAPLSKYKFPLEVLAFDLGVCLEDITYANTIDLGTIAKIMVASPAGRIAGVKLFGYNFGQTLDLGNFLGPATYAAAGIWLADQFVGGSEMGALKKLIPLLLAFSAGKVFDPAPVAENYVGALAGGSSNQLTYGTIQGF